jgi:hypothetical protein
MKNYFFGLIALIALAGYTTDDKYVPDPTTLNKKVMFGYQGWFAAPTDGSGLGYWKHWFRSNKPDSGFATFDFWPDMREYPTDVQHATDMKYPDGSPAKVYSAYHYGVVDLHFKWLKEHDLDGVFEQRFVTELKGRASLKHFNQVVRNVKQASEKYQRVYCIMYDISGAGEQWKEIGNTWWILWKLPKANLIFIMRAGRWWLSGDLGLTIPLLLQLLKQILCWTGFTRERKKSTRLLLWAV